MMPSFFPKEVMFCTTFSCIRLKHMAITAMPSRMYTVQKMNWNGTIKKPDAFASEYHRTASSSHLRVD